MPASVEPSTRETMLLALRDPANAAAWEAFYARYEPLIRRWIRGRRPRSGDEDDLTQEVLAKLFLKLPEYEYDPSKRFRGWLSQLVKNATHDYWRRSETDGVGGTTNVGIVSALPDPDDQDPLQQLLEVERALEEARIYLGASARVRSRVNPSRWRAFHLTAVEGRCGRDVAAELGMTAGAVYVARHHVTKLIRAEADRIRAEEEQPPASIRADSLEGDDHDDA